MNRERERRTDGHELQQWRGKVDEGDASGAGPGQRLDVHEVGDALLQVADAQTVHVLRARHRTSP